MGAPDQVPLVAVVVSIHRPDQALLRRLLASIHNQLAVRTRLYAVIDGYSDADDGTLLQSLRETGATVYTNRNNLGVKAAFAFGLRNAIAAEYSGSVRAFAFADQDDVWHPQKLIACLRALDAPGTALVHCDARVVMADGGIVALSLHRYENREVSITLLDHLLLNCVTGMTSVFTRETAACALHLMAGETSTLLHDHVTAVAAASVGNVLWINRSLVDYVQHGANQVGAIARSKSPRWKTLRVGNRKAYRDQSLAIFRDRHKLVRALKYEDHDHNMPYLRELEDMFLAGAPPGRLRLLVLYARAASRYLWLGQFRHWHVCVRCGAVAWRLRRAPAPD